MSTIPHTTACLAEWYELNPLTGEAGWTIHGGWIKGSAAEARQRIEARPNFDILVSCYDAIPNGDEVYLDI